MNSRLFGKLGLFALVLGGGPILAGGLIWHSHQTLSVNAATPKEGLPIQLNLPAQNLMATAESSAQLMDADTKSTPDFTQPKLNHATTPLQPAINRAPHIITNQQSCSGGLAQEFLCLFNQYRAQAGLGPISFNYSLTQVALGHSNWMNQTGSFSHEGINGSRLNDRCTAAGTTCRAENLAHNLLDAQKLLNSWVANPSHNRNLLGPYSIAGFGQAGSYVTLLLN